MLRSTLLVSIASIGLVMAAPGFTGTEALPPSAPPPAAPADVAQCHSERNLGACVTCCMEEGLPGNLCSRFCRTPIPPPPDGEPQP